MKVLLLSDVNSSHTQQWALGLAERGVEIGIFSLRNNNFAFAQNHAHIQILFAEDQPWKHYLGPLRNYDLFTYNNRLKKAVNDFQPDFVHAHGIGNHGLIGGFADLHPLIVSAWGSDIMAHPKKSILHRFFVQYALRKADLILATSNNLAEETKKYTTKEVLQTPFGIDLNRFRPNSSKKVFTKNKIVLGSVKGLKKIYNHDWSLRYFATLVEKHPDLALRFLLVGDGVEKEALIQLSKELGIESLVTFAGMVPHEVVPDYLGEIDILLNLSSRESFGVAVLEAAAMKIPAVASNIGGLPEVIQSGETGFLVNYKDKATVISTLEKLIVNSQLRKSMGQKAQIFVAQNYDRNHCIDRMIEIYQQVMLDI